MVAVLVGDKDAVAVTDGKAQRLERRRGSAHALAHIHDEIPLPAGTTLLLPEEPEYNEMNSAMKNL